MTLVLGETLDWLHAAGMGLIALGLIAIDGRAVRAFALKQAPASANAEGRPATIGTSPRR